MKLRQVILENPYLTLKGNTRAKQLFGELCALRSQAAQFNHHVGAYPFSADDMLATYLCFCEEKSDGYLIPIFSFKFISLNELKRFHLDLPLLKWLKNPINPNEMKIALQNYIDQNVDKNIWYGGAMALHPQYLTHPGVIRHSKGVTCSAMMGIIKDKKIDEVLTGALLQNESYRISQSVGFDLFLFDEPFSMSDYGDKPAYLFSFKKASLRALEYEKSYQSYWDERIHFMPIEELHIGSTNLRAIHTSAQ